MAWDEKSMREQGDSMSVMPTVEKPEEIAIESSGFNEVVQIDH